MFLDFYHLHQEPFGVTPDPAYLYPSRTHCEALDSLTEGILGGRGFLALIAEPGMGKTTLLYQVLEGLRDSARAAYLFQTQCNSREFFHYLLSELGVDATGMGLVAMHNKLNEMLFAEMLAGKRFVLIVDEAQNLDDSVLETIRLLSNFETSNTKLLQIVLAGQPQLGEKLGQKQLAQLLQRITVVNHLEALSPEETAGYVKHRLKVAGHTGGVLFEPEALALVAERSQGIPRNINKICHHALLEAHAQGSHTVSAEIVDKADRRLEVVAIARPTPKLLPTLTGTHSVATARIPATPHLTYKPLAKSGLPGWVLWACALIAALLLAGVALPPNTLKEMMQNMRGQVAATLISSLRHGTRRDATGYARTRFAEFSRSFLKLAGTDDGRQSSSVRELAESGGALDSQLSDWGIRNESARSNVAQGSPKVSDRDDSQTSLARELGLKISRIAIDPGHGGYDTGAVGRDGLLEKDLCLDVALRLGQLIEENIGGSEVVYTRKDDRHVSLEERTAIADEANADLLISIHANSSDNPEVRGVETYYLSLATSQESMHLATRENALAQSSLHDLSELIQRITRNEKTVESKQFAMDIQNQLSQRLELVSGRETNRGVKQAPFIVLTGASMPAVLSEISFVSNANDESLLLESGQRQRVAEGLYRGIAAYLDSLRSLPHTGQKLFSENRPSTSSLPAATASAALRNPLKLFTARN